MFGIWPKLIAPHNAPLLRAAEETHDLNSPASIAQLRKHWPADLVSGAIELTAARRKAAEKFDHPDHLVADVVGVEQASSIDVARHKARRFADAGVRHVADLCCGIGGDAMGLKEICDVSLFDLNPEKAWMARHNTSAPAVVADVTKLNLCGIPYHLDPDRRAGGKRQWKYEDYLPGPAFIEQVAKQDGAIKLSPGVEFDALPPGEIEVINRHGTLVQAVLWTGKLARHPRTATRIDDHQSVYANPGWLGTSLRGPGFPRSCRGVEDSATATPESFNTRSLTFSAPPDRPIPCGEPERYLYAVDPAIERAGLLGAFCEKTNLPAIHPSLGLLTSPKLITDPWLTGFELIETLPWREAKVRDWLNAHDAGVVEIKTRGKAVDPDALQKKLRGKGDQPFTLFILRFNEKIIAYITQRNK